MRAYIWQSARAAHRSLIIRWAARTWCAFPRNHTTMITITTEKTGDWYVARASRYGYEYTAPDRMTAFNHVLLQLMSKGALTY